LQGWAHIARARRPILLGRRAALTVVRAMPFLVGRASRCSPLRLPINVTIGEISAATAGNYQDQVTITVTAQ